MKKSTKRFVISTEAENSLGFKVRTTGIDLADFNKNPLLLWMHQRPKGERADEILPLGYWDDIEIKNGEITGVPVFDDSDDFAMKIYNKVENGTIKMASAGLKPVQFLESADGKWLEKSSLQEASLVDIGSNKEALAVALYNDDNELVKLADFNQTFNINKQKDMKLIQLSAAAVLPLLKLKEDAGEAEAQVAIQNLVTLAETQKNEILTLKDEKKELQDKIDLQEKEDKKTKAEELVNLAEQERKITKDEVPHYIKLAEADYETTKSILDAKKATPTVASQMGKGNSADELVKLSWKELEEKQKLVQLKESNLDAFKEKFKEEFGTEYKG